MQSSTRLLRTLTHSTVRALRTNAPCSCTLSLRIPTRPFSSSPTRTRIADDFVNMIQTDAARPIVSIASISDSTGFHLTDGLVCPSPIIILNGVLFMWDVKEPEQDMTWDGWLEEKLKVFEVVTPRPEILLVGTGRKGLFPPPAFKSYLNGLGIQVDVLDSRNACATYNLLAEEGRRVSAALYPLSPLDARAATKLPSTTLTQGRLPEVAV